MSRPRFFVLLGSPTSPEDALDHVEAKHGRIVCVKMLAAPEAGCIRGIAEIELREDLA